MLVEPCACRTNRERAAACPRESRGKLIWTPDASGMGPAEVVATDGSREMLTLGEEWAHYSESLARDWARVLHLDFEASDA